MREILFRGKRTDNGKWVEGYYVYDESGQTTENPTAYIVHLHKHPCGWQLLPFEVIPTSVSEFTGICDKNGKKIFEGDIIDTDITRPYLIVEFRDGCFMFNCNDGGEDYYDIMLPIVKEAHTEYRYGEVIGNIHDNPELLKEGDE